MSTLDKRALSAAYKERKSVAGVYALRCATSSQAWVGRALDVEKVWNRLQFSLVGRASPHRELQAAWNAHGASAFSFEILERLEEEALAFARDAQLKERLEHWREKLGAKAI